MATEESSIKKKTASFIVGKYFLAPRLTLETFLPSGATLPRARTNLGSVSVPESTIFLPMKEIAILIAGC